MLEKMVKAFVMDMLVEKIQEDLYLHVNSVVNLVKQVQKVRAAGNNNGKPQNKRATVEVDNEINRNPFENYEEDVQEI